MADDGDAEIDEVTCRRLWASVIIQALIDASAEARTPSEEVIKGQAVAWLTTEVGVTAQNFEEVCMAADIDPHRVRNFWRNYEGPPLTLQVLIKMRDGLLT